MKKEIAVAVVLCLLGLVSAIYGSYINLNFWPLVSAYLFGFAGGMWVSAAIVNYLAKHHAQ